MHADLWISGGKREITLHLDLGLDHADVPAPYDEVVRVLGVHEAGKVGLLDLEGRCGCHQHEVRGRDSALPAGSVDLGQGILGEHEGGGEVVFVSVGDLEASLKGKVLVIGRGDDEGGWVHRHGDAGKEDLGIHEGVGKVGAAELFLSRPMFVRKGKWLGV